MHHKWKESVYIAWKTTNAKSEWPTPDEKSHQVKE
jgi:hypothetical protein